MITWEKYISCEVEVTESIKGKEYIAKGTLVGVSDDCLDIYARGKRTTESFIALPIAKEAIVGFKCAKKARKLTMDEWELYCMNILGIHLGSVSVTGKGFAIKGWKLDGETIIPFDEEIDMLKLNGEGLDDE